MLLQVIESDAYRYPNYRNSNFQMGTFQKIPRLIYYSTKSKEDSPMKKSVLVLLAAVTSASLFGSCAQSGIYSDTTDASEIPYTDTTNTEHVTHTDTAELTKAPPPADRLLPEEDAYTAIADFSNKFLAAYTEISDGKANTLTSPLSAYLALSMVKEGAEGDTLKEMSAAMGNVHGSNIFALIFKLQALDKTTLSISNSLWVDSRLQLKASYAERLYAYYNAEGFPLPEESPEKEVNAYIEEHTNGLIRDMLAEGSLNDTVLALVNTLYMKAEWQTPFSSNATHKRIFTDAEGNISKVDFMYKTASWRIMETDEYMGVVLPYSDGELEFVAVMPKNADAPASDAIMWVTENGGFLKIAAESRSERIKLYIPKFTQNIAGSLKETLMNMGMNSAFDRFKANLNGIADDIYVDDVFQNAVLKLDEAGTEAAAATVVTLAPTSAAPPETEPRTVEFNRSFAFAVIHKESGAVLFAGEHNMP